jgi:hypothetical protein
MNYKSNGSDVGDWSKQAASEHSSRGKIAIMRKDQPDAYKVPSPTKVKGISSK